MLTLDGSFGEGGGQILRSALALSMVTGQAFRIERIRAQRPKSGLLRQHLAAVRAAAEVCGATLEGAELRSRELSFTPKAVQHRDYHWDIGSAGSTTLVLQTVLPALLSARGVSTLVLEGGTHNTSAPPFEFLDKAFRPVLARMGAKVELRLDRYGFHPRGGGRVVARIESTGHLTPIHLEPRDAVRRTGATAIVAALPRSIAERELAVVAERLDWEAPSLVVREIDGRQGPGNVLLLEVESEQATEVFTGFGQRGVRAEAVAAGAADEAARYLASRAAAGEHLADQLLLPMALAGGGSLVTLPLSSHARTNIEVIRRFLGVDIEVEPVGCGETRVGFAISPRSA